MRRRGFTLVDVIISLVILAIGILGLTAMVGVIGRQARLSRTDTQLAALARGEMERLLMVPPAELASGSREQGGYQVVWDVSAGVSGGVPSDAVRQLRLIVSYRVGGQLDRADTLTTLVRGTP